MTNDDDAGRPRDAEDALRRLAALFPRRPSWYVKPVRCEDCGKVERRGVTAVRCGACAARRARERQTYRQRLARHLKAGLVARNPAAGPVVRRERGIVLPVEAVKGRCEHCDQEFERLRTTARFCSARCRMAAHRAKG